MLFLVRWPILEAAIVRADDESHLLRILDEVGDPGQCTFEVYDGPLFVTFRTPARAKFTTTDSGEEQVELEGLEGFSDPQFLTAQIEENSDTSCEMAQAVASFAFPWTAQVLEEHAGNQGPPERASLEQALDADLDPGARLGTRASLAYILSPGGDEPFTIVHRPAVLPHEKMRRCEDIAVGASRPFPRLVVSDPKSDPSEEHSL